MRARAWTVLLISAASTACSEVAHQPSAAGAGAGAGGAPGGDAASSTSVTAASAGGASTGAGPSASSGGLDCAPLLACAGGCVDPAHDPANCGGCGVQCAVGEICAEGLCALTCSPGSELCRGACVDTQTSDDDCGSCGNACGAGLTCSAGQCVVACGPGTALCGSVCADLSTDPSHCGACDAPCPVVANASSVCVAGSCAFVCDPGFEDCDGLGPNGCEADVSSDALNCGACGVVCAPCVAGVCGDPLDPPTPCDTGTYGVLSGDPWVVCAADADTAWISANSQGEYEVTKICQKLGYTWVSQWGGNCQKVCGSCDPGFTQCWAPGTRMFDGAYSCNLPATYCGTVHWECSNAPPP